MIKKLLEEDSKRQIQGHAKALELIAQDRAYDGNDEFHPSLNINLQACIYLSEEEFDDYMSDLLQRRRRIHNRGLK